MKIAVYLRVSTDSQTTDNQIPDVENYIRSIPAPEVTYYKENESSWIANHQTELARLKSDIRSGKRKFDLFVVWAFDRLCRQGGIALIKEYEFFLSHGVKVISLKEPWSDMPQEFIPVMLALAGYIAEMESKRKSERIRAGNARTLKAGVTKTGRKIKALGRPKGSKDKPGTRRRTSGYRNRYLTNKVSESVTLEMASVN